jgi:hypothetical protein
MAIKFSEAILAEVPVITTGHGSRGQEVAHKLHQLDNTWELVKHFASFDQNTSSELHRAEGARHASAKMTTENGWVRLLEEINRRPSRLITKSTEWRSSQK